MWGLLVFVGCRKTEASADAGTARATVASAQDALREGAPCTLPTLPSIPDPESREICERIGGHWRDDWDPNARGTATGRGWQVLGRGNRRFRGCTGLRAPDEGRACTAPWECLGECVQGRCSPTIERRAETGCGPRCEQGVVRRVCID